MKSSGFTSKSDLLNQKLYENNQQKTHTNKHLNEIDEEIPWNQYCETIL